MKTFIICFHKMCFSLFNISAFFSVSSSQWYYSSSILRLALFFAILFSANYILFAILHFCCRYVLELLNSLNYQKCVNHDLGKYLCHVDVLLRCPSNESVKVPLGQRSRIPSHFRSATFFSYVACLSYYGSLSPTPLVAINSPKAYVIFFCWRNQFSKSILREII